MTKKVIFQMTALEMIDWILNHPLTMAYLEIISRDEDNNLKR